MRQRIVLKKCFNMRIRGERFAVMMLDNSNGVINCRFFLSEGSVHSMEINIKKALLNWLSALMR